MEMTPCSLYSINKAFIIIIKSCRVVQLATDQAEIVRRAKEVKRG